MSNVVQWFVHRIKMIPPIQNSELKGFLHDKTPRQNCVFFNMAGVSSVFIFICNSLRKSPGCFSQKDYKV